MSDVYFGGGPIDGQVSGGDPMGGMTGGGMPDPAAMMGGGGEEAPAESDSAQLSQLLAHLRQILSMQSIIEKNKLLLSKAETLIQQVKTNEEADDEAAMGGKLTPGVMRKLGGGGGF